MEQVNVKVKKWGNSFGIVLPKCLVENQELKEGVEISLLIGSKQKTVGDLINLSKKNSLKKMNVKKIMNEMDKELWN